MRLYEVYYQKPIQGKYSVFTRDDIYRDTIDATHQVVRNMVADNIEEVFRYMQGENWGPNGEARATIERLGLSHTSMSVNDVIRDVRAAKWYQVMFFGFRELTDSLKNQG